MTIPKYLNTNKGSAVFWVTIFALVGITAFIWWSSLDQPTISQKTNSDSASTTNTEVTVQLSWFHTAEFAGFYIAQDKGYYAEHGITVNLIEANPPEAPTASVIAGDADFGISGIDGILLSKEEGSPMTALAAIYQQSPVTFITLQESGITKPEDFIGKRVTMECGSNAEYPQRAVLSKLNIPSDQITEVCSTYSIDQLLNDETDVFAGFVTNEPILLELLGHKVNNILVTDYGVNFYPNMIFTKNEMINTNRTLVQNFVAATIRGYEYALANPDEAVVATLARESSLGDLSEEHQLMTMTVQTPLIFTGDTPIGWMDSTIWEQGVDILLEQNIISQEHDLSEVFTNDFIPN